MFTLKKAYNTYILFKLESVTLSGIILGCIVKSVRQLLVLKEIFKEDMAVSQIPFTSTQNLQENCGIAYSIGRFFLNKSSHSLFIYRQKCRTLYYQSHGNCEVAHSQICENLQCLLFYLRFLLATIVLQILYSSYCVQEIEMIYHQYCILS